MFEHMDGVMRALAKKMTQWKEDLSFTVRVARQKLSQYYVGMTPMTGKLQITAHILDPFRKFRLFENQDMGTDINPEDKISYTTQYQHAFLKYVQDECCTKQRRLPVIKNKIV